MRLVATEYDPVTGITEEFYYNEETGRVTINRIQDVEDQLAFNRQAYASHNGRPQYADSEGGAHHVARIPLIVIEQWKEKGFDWFQSTDAERRKVLNDPANRHLLVRPGRL